MRNLLYTSPFTGKKTAPARGKFVQFLSIMFFLPLLLCQGQTLTVATVNVWSGLDYKGTWTVGEYETKKRREERFHILVDELKKLHPDLIALQEVNPAGGFSCSLAAELGYDYISQRENAGMKAGRVGIPANLNEGIAILAKKELQLHFVDVWDLSHSFGVFGNVLSFHFSENNIALVGRITAGNTAFFVVNAHLVAAVPDDSANRAALKQITGDSFSYQEAAARLHDRAQKRLQETKQLAEMIGQHCSTAPVILVGDFNATPESPEIRYLTEDQQYIDAALHTGSGDRPTWDVEHNPNIAYSRLFQDSSAQQPAVLERLSAQYDGISRRIDYVFLNKKFQSGNVLNTKIFLDSARSGIFSSDHYGMLAEIEVPKIEENSDTFHEPEFEGLPILSYDTDVGFGYGAKVFLLNQLGSDESFDLVLFNSTKGERWYRFVFSMPDFELRQGTRYPFAFDVTVDYDKWISNSFFGTGNRSAFSSREIYTREPLEISAALSRGFTEHSVLQIGIRYKTVTNSNLPVNSPLRDPVTPLNSSRVTANSLFMEYRFDSRDSYTNPARGYVLQGEFEYAPKTALSNVSLKRIGSTFQYYSTLFYPKTVFAFRTQWQTLGSEQVPVQMLLPVGGNRTLRGSPQDRFLEKTSAIVNCELRFPIVWRFGGATGVDAGKVWDGPSKIDLTRWATNPVAGIRLYMDTFVVRLDLGFGHETTGFYLNFGQLF